MEKTDNWGFPVEAKKDSDYFNFSEGETKLRVLTQPVKVRQYFKDGKYVLVDDNYSGEEKATTKGWSWCVIRDIGELKIVKFLFSVIKLVQALMVNEEYAFEGFPMPYDLTIKATGDGLERRYEVVAARKNSPVTEAELEALEKKTSIQDIISKMRDKAGTKPAYPQPDAEDETPF